jgi:hypothetical protein
MEKKEKKKESPKSMIRPICAHIKNGHGVRKFGRRGWCQWIKSSFGSERVFVGEYNLFPAPQDEQHAFA